MLTVVELRRKANRYFTTYLGQLALGTEASLFPWAIPGTLPNRAETLTALLATEMPQLLALAQPQRPDGYQLETETTTLRTGGFGQQTWPRRVVFPSARELLAFLGPPYQRQARHFATVLAELRQTLPELPADWLGRHHALVLKYALAEWRDLVHVCRYFLTVARSPETPALFLRELPVAVHTKFVEAHETVLTTLLRELLPDYLDAAGKTFAARLRLREPEHLVYVRLLDPQLSASLPFGLSEFRLPLRTFRQFNPPGNTVVITENKITFLTLPPLAGTVAVWGEGYAVHLLEAAAWLATRTVLYWGDLDAAGFQILNRLRRYAPTARALLMNAATLAQYQPFQVSCPALPTPPPQQYLSSTEHALYEQLARQGLRLEQERIPHARLLAALREEYPHLLG